MITNGQVKVSVQYDCQECRILELDSIYSDSSKLVEAIQNAYIRYTRGKNANLLSFDTLWIDRRAVVLKVSSVAKHLYTQITYIGLSDTFYYENSSLLNQSVVLTDLHQLRNTGFPFAYTTISLKKDSSYLLKLSAGPKILFDSLHFDKEVVDYKVIDNVLNIRYDQPFSQKKFEHIARKLAALSYFDLTSEPKLVFAQGRAVVYLSLKRVKNNNFDGLVGYQSMPNQNAGSFTGFLNLYINGLYRKPIVIDLNWKSFQNSSQKAFLNYNQDYVFGKNLYYGINLSYLKQDSSFSNVQYVIETGQFVTPQLKFGVGYINFRNTALSDTSTSSYKKRGGFLNIQLKSNDSSNNLNTHGKAKVGFFNKNLNDKNDHNQLLLEFSLSRRFRFKNSPWHILSSLSTGWLFSDKVINTSEMFSIGGVYSLRGYLENQFYVPAFAMQNSQLEYWFGNDYLFLLADYGFLQLARSQSFSGFCGLGVGINIGINASRLNIIYAVGSDNNGNFNLNDSKIHLGFRALF